MTKYDIINVRRYEQMDNYVNKYVMAQLILRVQRGCDSPSCKKEGEVQLHEATKKLLNGGFRGWKHEAVFVANSNNKLMDAVSMRVSR
jgi:hypothetical protein